MSECWRCCFCGGMPKENYKDPLTGEPLYWEPGTSTREMGFLGVGYNMYFCSPHCVHKYKKENESWQRQTTSKTSSTKN